jgi:hypothetical protein
VLGKGYIISHCVAFIKKEQEEQIFRLYITDALKILTENTAKMYGGASLTKRYADIIDMSKPVETRTQEEIIDHIKRKLAHGSAGTRSENNA